MRKLGLSVVVLSLVANCAFAQGAFVGAKIGPMHEFIDIENSDLDSTHAAIGINGGYDFDKFRVYGEINYNFDADLAKADIDEGEAKITTSSREYILGADYYLNKINNVKLFVGGFAGFENRTFKATFTSKVGGVNSGTFSLAKSAFMLGARFGGIYPLSRNGDLEFGASLSKPFHKSNIGITKLGAFVGYTYKF